MSSRKNKTNLALAGNNYTDSNETICMYISDADFLRCRLSFTGQACALMNSITAWTLFSVKVWCKCMMQCKCYGFVQPRAWLESGTEAINLTFHCEINTLCQPLSVSLLFHLRNNMQVTVQTPLLEKGKGEKSKCGEWRRRPCGLELRELGWRGEGPWGKTKHRTRDTAGNLVRGHSQ